MEMEPMIAIRGLRVAYRDNEVLKGIDLNVDQGQFVALLGASGCGKTTLLRTISGFTQAKAGSIDVQGRNVLGEPPERRDMAMVFQSYALWSHMNVMQNIGYGLKLRQVPREQIKARVLALLDMLDLQGFENRPVAELSGGQRQRVALGRALAVEPKILLLDEPLSNLDARIRLQMRHEIRSIQKRLGLTAMLVTHDREEAMVMADRVVVLDQGRVAQIGTPEEVFQRPASPYVASFMGAENIVDCDALREGDSVALSVPNASQARVKGVHMAGDAAGPVQVHFRSERATLHLDGAPSADALKLPGRITQSSYLGGGYRCTVHTDSGQFFIDHPASLASGATVTVCIPADALHVYAREAHRSAAAPV